MTPLDFRTTQSAHSPSRRSSAKRTLWCALILAITAIFMATPEADAAKRRRSPAASVQKGEMNVRSAILLDAVSGNVLYEQNADRRIPPASLTKIVSMYVAMDAMAAGKVKPTDTVRVSRQAARQGGSRMFLKAGDRVSMDRLLFGMAISSGNDASLAVAEKVAGSSTSFVKLMNQKMRALNIPNTVFKNVHGLPAQGQVTTARDMARITVSYLKNYPNSLRFHKATAIKHNGVVTTNKNPLLRNYPGADGLKTGWVTASGYNIVTTAKRGNQRLIAVVLGADNAKTRAMEIRRLMDAGFQASAKKTSVAAVLGVRDKNYTAEAPAQKAQQKAAVKKKSSSQKSKATSAKKSNAIKKTNTKKQTATATKKASAKKQQAAASSKKQAQKKQPATKQAQKKQPSKNTWSAAGSLMDS